MFYIINVDVRVYTALDSLNFNLQKLVNAFLVRTYYMPCPFEFYLFILCVENETMNLIWT